MKARGWHFRGWLMILAGWGQVAVPIRSASVMSEPPPVHFTVFAADPIADLAYLPEAGAKPVPLVFYPTARSPRYQYRGRGPLRLVDARSGELRATVQLPPDSKDFLLLISRVPVGTGRPAGSVRVEAIDDGRTGLRAGQIRILNGSELKLAGEINGQRVDLGPGLNPPIAVGGTVRIMLRTPWRDRSYQAVAATVELSAGERALLILFPPLRTGSLEPQFRVLVDGI